MNLRRHALALLVFGTVTVGACSSDDEGAGAQATAEKDAFLRDYCSLVSGCCNRIFVTPIDDPTCKERIAALDPKMVADATAQKDCLAQLRKVNLLPDFCTEFGNLDLPACPDPRRKELTGTKKLGDACATTAECAPSFEGQVACNGVCQVTKRGKEGDTPCVATVAGDIETRTSDSPSGPAVFVCFARDELVCDPTAKKCIKPIATGGACTDTTGCVSGDYCKATDKKCTARKGNGSSCGGDECRGNCASGFCAAPSDEGGTCTSNAGCIEKLACSGGKCTKPAANVRLEPLCVTKT